MILRNDNDNLKHALKLSEFKSWLSFSRAMKILILLFVNIWEYILSVLYLAKLVDFHQAARFMKQN